jgi:hypothetical protein
MLAIAATCTSRARSAENTLAIGSLASTVPPDVVKDLARIGKLREAINVSNIVLCRSSASCCEG